MKGIVPLLSAVSLLLCSSCATLFQGTSEEVMVASDPPGANVSVNDGRSGSTPFSFRVPRNEDLQIHISKPGYQSVDLTDTSKFEWGYGISDLLFTGLIGLGVDAIDGASFYHQQTMVTAHLDPNVPMATSPIAPSASVSLASPSAVAPVAAAAPAGVVPSVATAPAASGQSSVAPPAPAQEGNKAF